MRRHAMILAATALLAATPAMAAKAAPGEGKKKRHPKPTQEIEQGPMTRQQRRYLQRKGLLA